MDFGKFSDLTYEEVAENYPAYARWARETVMKGSQAGQENLRKFVAWLDRDQTCTKVENARPS